MPLGIRLQHSPSAFAFHCLSIEVLTAGTKSGYTFTYADGPGDKPNAAPTGGCAGDNTYTVNAAPATPGTTG
jgi:hypothetical protein